LTFDDYVVLFSRPPYAWPPDVTRRQSIRDLMLLVNAFESMEMR